VVAGLALTLSACQSDLGTEPLSANPSQSAFTATASASGPVARVRCEVRSNRSKISVDGNDLRPLGGMFSARVRSGANTAHCPAPARGRR
jgi:hypothetical protein